MLFPPPPRHPPHDVVYRYDVLVDSRIRRLQMPNVCLYNTSLEGTALSGDRLGISKSVFEAFKFAANKACSLWTIGKYETVRNAFLDLTYRYRYDNRILNQFEPRSTETNSLDLPHI
jgi:hypothetical protein